MSAVPPADFVSHFDPENPRHKEWLLRSLQELTRLRPDALNEGGDLHAIWSGAKPLPSAGSPGKGTRHLRVPYFSQRDSDTSQAERMCFSSSCAMLLEFLRPGTLRGGNGDDQYLGVVRPFGDTTDAAAQVRALAKMGVQSRFAHDVDFLQIERQIDRGVPVPCGYLHRGPLERPIGGGHWLIVIGYTAREVIVHDPFGEPDLLTGATLNRNGKGLRLTRENFGRRWMVEPVGDGAYRYAPGRGWAIIAEP